MDLAHRTARAATLVTPDGQVLDQPLDLVAADLVGGALDEGADVHGRVVGADDLLVVVVPALRVEVARLDQPEVVDQQVAGRVLVAVVDEVAGPALAADGVAGAERVVSVVRVV